MIRRGKAYDLLAIQAGLDAGLIAPTPEEVHQDLAAREVRDTRWAEYDLMLRDTQTFTVRAIVEWLAAHGAEVGKSSVDRDRHARLERERRFELAGLRAKQIAEVVSAGDQADITEATMRVVDQLLFNAFAELPAGALEMTTPSQLLKAINTLSDLNRSKAQVDMWKTKVKAMQVEFDKAIDSGRVGKTGKIEWTAQKAEEISRKIFGGVA